MRTLKEKKQLIFSELFDYLKESISFPLTEEALRNRLKSLIDREYLTELEDKYWYID